MSDPIQQIKRDLHDGCEKFRMLKKHPFIVSRSTHDQFGSSAATLWVVNLGRILMISLVTVHANECDGR